jgi:hypothetical protein
MTCAPTTIGRSRRLFPDRTFYIYERENGKVRGKLIPIGVR